MKSKVEKLSDNGKGELANAGTAQCYDFNSEAAKTMGLFDAFWLRTHPKEERFFREAMEGESPLLDHLAQVGKADCLWIIVSRGPDGGTTVNPMFEMAGVKITLSVATEVINETPFANQSDALCVRQ
ncbi:hypothetical protein [Jannaschia sp. CCS1]|uniref:hypothetical protein n=1 Tax=Jannaschia sp. (strain CCS1) TaxID=290400 RepID=UPI000053BFF7|nr:hypothetical protein [Jannaschia sp. CCS1]ABD53152.1 hypothetical protein Jann_0235 [Jannaschia sp. CCS1]